MTIRMVHPEHGATHAYDTGEVDRLKALGWLVEGEKSASDDHLSNLKSALLVKLPVVEEPEKRKPGRPAKVK